jgi:hypothetical protein
MLATKSDLSEIHVDDTCCYALVCTDILFSNDDIARTLPVTNLLQEFNDALLSLPRFLYSGMNDFTVSSIGQNAVTPPSTANWNVECTLGGVAKRT